MNTYTDPSHSSSSTIRPFCRSLQWKERIRISFCLLKSRSLHYNAPSSFLVLCVRPSGAVARTQKLRLPSRPAPRGARGFWGYQRFPLAQLGIGYNIASHAATANLSDTVKSVVTGIESEFYLWYNSHFVSALIL